MSDNKQIVIIGAGQAGLATSYFFKQAALDHIVLERGQIGESWLSQRWDSFYLNTPNWTNHLPGMQFYPDQEDAFSNVDQLIAYFNTYVSKFDLPVRTNTTVSEIKQLPDGNFQVRFNEESVIAKVVILASGSMSRPVIPPMASHLDEITSLSAGSYKNPAQLPEGAVLVVGAGQSGCQIAEDLLEAGKKVYLCASGVGRAPRTYRGRDILRWMADTGFMDVKPSDLQDPAMQYIRQPQISGTKGGHTVSFQSLARDGATLLGKLSNINGFQISIKPDLMESIKAADETAKMVRTMVDGYVHEKGIQAPPAEPDPGEPDLPDLHGSEKITEINLKSENIASVIWCIGFDADWAWVNLDIFNEKGIPEHENGITKLPGVYCLGFPWLSKRKSGIIYGITEDAERITSHVQNYLKIKSV